MAEEAYGEDSDIRAGMAVETTGRALGESDLSKPRVVGVESGENGKQDKIVVEKGLIFKKTIDVPIDRVKVVEPVRSEKSEDGKVIVDASEELSDSLSAQGRQALPPAADRHEEDGGLAGQVAGVADSGAGVFSELGPGLLNGMAGNDSSAVTTFAINGAQVGYSQLWLIVLSLPLMQACEYATARIGRLTKQGLSGLLREHYGLKVAVPAGILLIVANVALITADLVAVGSGLELLSGIKWVWFVVPVALVIWYVTVYQDFDRIKKIFLAMSLVFVAYLVTAIFSKPDWGSLLAGTFVPHLGLGFAAISAAVALLGAYISPYQLVWQARAETEERRAGGLRQQVKSASLDIATGVVSGSLVSYAIIVSTADTLHAKHQQINSAIDAARSLEPLLGPFAKYLFAVGLIGSGLIAIPVLLASTSYGVTETFGWPSSLSKKPWQNEGFYLILTGALVVGLVLAELRLDPMGLIFWANVLQGVLAPILVVLIMVVGNNGKIMRGAKLTALTNVGLGATALLMAVGAVLLFFGLATGQGS